jgi:hypothetical protein
VDIIKYFVEEPVSLETLTPDSDADARRQGQPPIMLQALLAGEKYARAYLAGTNIDTGRIGLTALSAPDAFILPVMSWIGKRRIFVSSVRDPRREADQAEARRLLFDPSGINAIVVGEDVPDGALVAAAAGRSRRYALPPLREVLDGGFSILFPEPAHHGFDWSIFSPTVIRPDLVDAFLRDRRERVRVFVLPYQRARSEEKFYFESWALNGTLPDYIEEL